MQDVLVLSGGIMKTIEFLFFDCFTVQYFECSGMIENF